MADYYTQFSFNVECDDPQAVVAEYDALAYAEHDLTDDEIENHPFYADAGYPAGAPEMQAFTDDRPPHVWLHSDDSDVDVTVDVIRWLFTKPGTPDLVEFEWANTCSKPRIDAFGGGAVIVHRDGTREYTSSGQWLYEQFLLRAEKEAGNG